MNMRGWLKEQVEKPAKKAMPILSFPSVSLLRVSVRQLVGNAALQAEAMRRIAARTNALAAVSMMDLSVEAEAFGSQVRFSDNEVPTVVGACVTDMAQAEALAVPPVGKCRTGQYVEAISKATSLIKDRPILAGVIGPFSLAGRLLDVSEAMVLCLTEPELVHAVLEKVTAFTISYIRAYKAVGANGVVMAEPLAGILSPILAAAFSSPYVRRIASAVQDEKFIVIYHNCGNNTLLMIDSILSTGCDAYHFGNAISMKEMLSRIPVDIPVMGNVDPASQFMNGTPGSIQAETLRILGECAPWHPNFIISSGCDIPPMSPWENIDAFFDAVEAYYRK